MTTAGTMTDDPKKSGVPDFLQVQNRRPLAPEDQARLAATLAAESAARYSADARTADALARDELARDELVRQRRQRALDGFRNRTAGAKARVAREGRWAPGCSWDPVRGRLIHPTSEWDPAKDAWVPRDGSSSPLPPNAEETKIMAKEKKVREKKAAGEPRGRSVKRPVGLVANFGQVREGTARADVIAMGVKGCTVEALAKKIGKDRQTVMTHLFCLNRDCAIGYEVDNDWLTVTLPGSKTLADAIKPAAEAA